MGWQCLEDTLEEEGYESRHASALSSKASNNGNSSIVDTFLFLALYYSCF